MDFDQDATERKKGSGTKVFAPIFVLRRGKCGVAWRVHCLIPFFFLLSFVPFPPRCQADCISSDANSTKDICTCQEGETSSPMHSFARASISQARIIALFACMIYATDNGCQPSKCASVSSSSHLFFGSVYSSLSFQRALDDRGRQRRPPTNAQMVGVLANTHTKPASDVVMDFAGENPS